MNVTDMLDQSHLQVIQVLDDLPEVEWDIPGVCGDWSVKDIIGHLASYEYVLIDMLNTLSGNEPTASLRTFIDDPASFDDIQVASRRYDTAQQVEDEYQEAQLQSTALLTRIHPEHVSQPGTIPGLPANQSVADFIQTMSEHTRQHCVQIANSRQKSDKLEGLKES